MNPESQKLKPGDLLQFVDNAGPVPGWIGSTRRDAEPHEQSEARWGLKISQHFDWTWKSGGVPGHMVYIGQRYLDGKTLHEVLWQGNVHRLKPYDIRYLRRVRGEDIQADDRAGFLDMTKKGG
jgi:hypothetical protein